MVGKTRWSHNKGERERGKRMRKDNAPTRPRGDRFLAALAETVVVGD